MFKLPSTHAAIGAKMELPEWLRGDVIDVRRQVAAWQAQGQKLPPRKVGLNNMASWYLTGPRTSLLHLIFRLLHDLSDHLLIFLVN